MLRLKSKFSRCSLVVFLYFQDAFPVIPKVCAAQHYTSFSSTLANVEENHLTLAESPRCWKSAISLIHNTQPTPDRGEQAIATICKIMPENKLKLLALEIARCHLEDLGKPLMNDPLLLDQCSAVSWDEPRDIHMCLKHLTDVGAHSYTHYVSYVQHLCTRLTQELMMNIQHEATSEIARRQAQISLRSVELAERQAEQMTELLQMPEHIKERLSDELGESLRVNFAELLEQELRNQLPTQLHEHLGAQLELVFSNHASEQARLADMVLKQAEQMSFEQSHRIEEFYERHRVIWESQLQEQRDKVKVLSDVVSRTTQTIQPLLGIQSLVMAATQGYTWLTLLLHFLGTFNIFWLITRPQRCQRFRNYLFCLIVMEALFEMGVLALQKHGLITEGERMSALLEVRRWMLFLECMVYLIGLFFGGTHCRSNEHDMQSNDVLREHVENAFLVDGSLPSNHSKSNRARVLSRQDSGALTPKPKDAHPRGYRRIFESSAEATMPAPVRLTAVSPSSVDPGMVARPFTVSHVVASQRRVESHVSPRNLRTMTESCHENKRTECGCWSRMNQFDVTGSGDNDDDPTDYAQIAPSLTEPSTQEWKPEGLFTDNVQFSKRPRSPPTESELTIRRKRAKVATDHP